MKEVKEVKVNETFSGLGMKKLGKDEYIVYRINVDSEGSGDIEVIKKLDSKAECIALYQLENVKSVLEFNDLK